MHGQVESVFHERSIEALARGDQSQGPMIHHAHSWGPVQVDLPPLRTGCNFLEIWPVREWPQQGLWRHPSYESYAPPLFIMHNVLVHSSAGILCVGGSVVSETLVHTSPERHGYGALARGISLQADAGAGKPKVLRGIHISVLAGSEADYTHAMLDGLARLSAVPSNYLAAAASLLVPRGGAAQAEALEFLDLPPSIAVREVGLQETLLVETLVLPLSVSGEASFHPCVLDFYRRVSANVPSVRRRLPRRFVIDSRGARSRGLVNETEMLAALARLGFEPVRLEDLSLAEQVCLFRQAEAVVSTQGAGLANLGYAHPGCVVIELMPDALVDWRFRHLAAVAGVQYDCVLGRARKPWPALDEDAGHGLWEVSAQHVAAAAAAAVGSAARAA